MSNFSPNSPLCTSSSPVDAGLSRPYVAVWPGTSLPDKQSRQVKINKESMRHSMTFPIKQKQTEQSMITLSPCLSAFNCNHITGAACHQSWLTSIHQSLMRHSVDGNTKRGINFTQDPHLENMRHERIIFPLTCNNQLAVLFGYYYGYINIFIICSNVQLTYP